MLADASLALVINPESCHRMHVYNTPDRSCTILGQEHRKGEMDNNQEM